MIEFGLKALWDVTLPLETFLTPQEADNFRNYIYNATITQLAAGDSCKTASNVDCYGSGGLCTPVFDAIKGVYSYECLNTVEPNDKYTFDIYTIGLEIPQSFEYDTPGQYGRGPGITPEFYGHHTHNYHPDLLSTSGAFGYNSAVITLDKSQKSIQPLSYCALKGNSWWNPSLPICDPDVKMPFNPNINSDRQQTVQIDLQTTNVYGLAGTDTWQKGATYSCHLHGYLYSYYNFWDCDSGDGFVAMWYVQPSLGVIVCPRPILKAANKDDDLCYYIFKWAAGFWPRENTPRAGGDKFAYMPELDPDYSKESRGNTKGFSITNYKLPDESRATLTFTLDWKNPRPSQVVATLANPNPLNPSAGSIPLRYGYEHPISFAQVKTALKQEEDYSTNLNINDYTLRPTTTPTPAPTQLTPAPTT